MTTYDQPDLFGDYDKAKERARIARQPHTCPYCGVTEPNAFLLSNNHGIDTPGTDTISGYPKGEHPNFGPYCMAQYLIRNHLILAATRGDADFLEDQKARARAHHLDVDAILAEANG